MNLKFLLQKTANKYKFNFIKGDILTYIQNLDFNNVDFDKIITMTEASLDKFKSWKVINNFNTKLPKK